MGLDTFSDIRVGVGVRVRIRVEVMVRVRVRVRIRGTVMVRSVFLETSPVARFKPGQRRGLSVRGRRGLQGEDTGFTQMY